MKCAPCPEKKCTKGKDCTGLKEELKDRYVGEDLKILVTADKMTEKFYMPGGKRQGSGPYPVGAIYSRFYRKKRLHLEK